MGVVPTSRTTLRDAEQEAHLDRYGFAVVPFLNPAEFAEVHAAYEEIGTAPDDPRLSITWSFHSRSADHKRRIKQVVGRLIEGATQRLLDRHTVYLTTFITKWPGDQSAFGPHQDPSLVDERKYRGVVVWLPLCPTGRTDGVDNGMLHVVPGSHRVHPHLREQNVNASPLRELDEELIWQHAVGVPTRPGEAIVFDNRLVHFSPPNQSTEPRVVLSLGVRCDEGECVVLRPSGEGYLNLFTVDDDYYIDVLPAESHLFEPTGPPLATVPAAEVPVTAAQLVATSQQVDRPSGVVEPTAADHSALPGVFCHFCGGNDGLEAVSREGRANAQLVCDTCARGAVPQPQAGRMGRRGRLARWWTSGRNRSTHGRTS